MSLKSAHGTFHEAALALYRSRPHHILPFVGAAFTGDRTELLRAMVVGINTHIGEREWDPDPAANRPAPEWFATWFRNREHRHEKRLHKEATALLRGLTARDGILKGCISEWPESFYSTNAIKVHLPDTDGKRADQVPDSLFNDHMSTWYAELDLMAQHGVLPQIIMIFGRPFWSRACASFRLPDGRFNHLRVADYRHSPGSCLHYVNRLRLDGASGAQETLLVRLRHPSARTQKGSASWLLAQEGLKGAAEWSAGF